MDGQQNGGLFELSDDFARKNVSLPVSFSISPDLHLAAHAHAQDGLEGPVKPGDPALLSRVQRLIVDMGVADEEGLLEIHWRPAGIEC